jgi:putative transposase
VILTYRFRLLPLKSQHRALERLCAAQRELYNAALEERIDCYRKTGKTRTYIDQCKALTEFPHALPEMGELPGRLQRWTLKRLDDAFQGFFRRLKARSGKAGFTRFRGKGRWEAFGFCEFSGIRFDGKRLVRLSHPPGPQCELEHSSRRDWRGGA